MLSLHPSARATVPRMGAPSTAELRRLRDRLDFYEQPITMFNRPVENDPTHLVNAPIVARGDETACLLVRVARRTMAAVRKLLSRRLGVSAGAKDKRPMAALSKPRAEAVAKRDGQVRVGRAAAPAPRRFQEMDDAMRFRLALAGIRVQRTPPVYTVEV